MVESIQLPAISPSMSRIILTHIESDLRNLLQTAHNFQRHGNKNNLTGNSNVDIMLFLFSYDQLAQFCTTIYLIHIL